METRAPYKTKRLQGDDRLAMSNETTQENPVQNTIICTGFLDKFGNVNGQPIVDKLRAYHGQYVTVSIEIHG